MFTCPRIRPAGAQRRRGDVAHSSTAPTTVHTTTAAHETKRIPSLVAYPLPTSVPLLARSGSMCLRKVEPFLNSKVGGEVSINLSLLTLCLRSALASGGVSLANWYAKGIDIYTIL